MCGTGDINVQDFKAHAVIVGGSWHFREKVGKSSHISYLIFYKRRAVCIDFIFFSPTTGDEVVLGSGVQFHPGRAGTSAAVHHRLLSAPPWRIQHSLPLFSDHRRPHSQHFAHCTHLVSRGSYQQTTIVFRLLLNHLCGIQVCLVNIFFKNSSRV